MADDLHAIADLIGDAFDLAPIEVSDLLKASPFIAALGMVPSSNGTTHKYTKETGAPVVGFRAENGGRDLDSSDDTAVTVNLKILDYTWQVDVAVADAWRRGRAAYVAREGSRHVRATLIAYEKQVINGTVGIGDAAGFTGLRQASTVDALADTMVVDATGTTVNGASSVWAVRLAEDGVTGVFKGEGDAFEVGETVVVPRVVNPGTDNKTFPTYYTPGCTWLAMQVGCAFDIGRIANLTSQAGKTLTDALISQLLEKFPIGFGPTHLLMSRRSRGQLQRSRTATNATGAPAPIPEESFGVPIIATDAIADNEALLT
jgi:hypothetical protein